MRKRLAVSNVIMFAVPVAVTAAVALAALGAVSVNRLSTCRKRKCRPSHRPLRAIRQDARNTIARVCGSVALGVQLCFDKICRSGVLDIKHLQRGAPQMRTGMPLRRIRRRFHTRCPIFRSPIRRYRRYCRSIRRGRMPICGNTICPRCPPRIHSPRRTGRPCLLCLPFHRARRVRACPYRCCRKTSCRLSLCLSCPGGQTVR